MLIAKKVLPLHGGVRFVLPRAPHDDDAVPHDAAPGAHEPLQHANGVPLRGDALHGAGAVAPSSDAGVLHAIDGVLAELLVHVEGGVVRKPPKSSALPCAHQCALPYQCGSKIRNRMHCSLKVINA